MGMAPPAIKILSLLMPKLGNEVEIDLQHNQGAIPIINKGTGGLLRPCLRIL